MELYPFKEAIQAGLGGVMVGHLQVPALEPDRITPSSLSHSIVTDLLRGCLLYTSQHNVRYAYDTTQQCEDTDHPNGCTQDAHSVL